VNNNFFKKRILIGEKFIGENEPVFIIAEAGVSHFGEIEKCYKLVDLAVEAKADAIKFQIFDINSFITKESKDWYDRMKSRSLGIHDYEKVQKYCIKKRIIFFLTAHDEKSFKEVIKLDPPLFKIGSGEVQNIKFVRNIFKSCNKPVLYSTGMHSINDIKQVIKLCKKLKKKDVVFMQCTSTYPTKLKNVNLNTIDFYKDKISSIVGYSDHTEGMDVPMLAVAKGAKVIEKHISLDFNVKNAQDWKVSCGPKNLKEFVLKLRKVEESLGSYEKIITEEEYDSLLWARKSIVVSKNIEKNKILKLKHLTSKRPGTGISPILLKDVIGKRTKLKIEKDTILEWEMLN
jgi:N,N'-diacetyllegionaminate synthase